MTIPEAATQKFHRLRQMEMIAVATSEGLRPEVDHWRDQISRLSIGLTDVRRQYGELTVGKAGEAYISTQRKVPGSTPGGHRMTTYEVTDERRPDLDGYTMPLWSAQQRLAEAREQQGQAAERAGALRQAVAEAKRALQAHGWREER